MPSNSSSEDSDAPETFSLAQSKSAAKSQKEVLRKAEAAEKERKKERNRQKDRKLKERALLTGKVKKVVAEKGSEVGDVQARMKGAMRDVDAELSDEEGYDEEKEGNEDDDDEFWGNDEENTSNDDEDMEKSGESSEEDADEDMLHAEENPSGDDSDEDSSSEAPLNPHHLPEHLFATAFAPKSKSTDAAIAPSSRKAAFVQKQSRKRRNRAKDIVVGSHVVRALSTAVQPASKTMPSAKANRFLNRSLALKGNKNMARAKGWERRPANVGVLKPSGGPAVGFVRK